MSNPQIENGYTKIANEIIEAICKTNFNGYQSRLLWAVIRKTYGFKKKEAWISLSQFSNLTGLRKQHISRAKKELVARKILVTSIGYKIKFNKDYSQWIELPNGVTNHSVTKSGKGVTKRGKKSNLTGGTQKKVTKETNTKEIDTNVSTAKAEYGNKDINLMLVALKKTIDIEAFVDSSIERNMAKHCLTLIKKIGREEFKFRLSSLLTDTFHTKNCNKIKYVYNNIKGFKKSMSSKVVSV